MRWAVFLQEHMHMPCECMSTAVNGHCTCSLPFPLNRPDRGAVGSLIGKAATPLRPKAATGCYRQTQPVGPWALLTLSADADKTTSESGTNRTAVTCANHTEATSTTASDTGEVNSIANVGMGSETGKGGISTRALMITMVT